MGFIYAYLKIIFKIYFLLSWVFFAAQAFSNYGEQGLLSSCGVWASHCSGFSHHGVLALGPHHWAQALGVRVPTTGSAVVVHGLSCSTSCAIFLDQRSNLHLLHWQADSLPLSHEGSHIYIYIFFLKKE